MLRHTSHFALMQRPEINGESGMLRAFEFACTLFKIPTKSLRASVLISTAEPPFSSCFHSLVSMSMVYARRLCDEQHEASALREAFCRILGLISRLVGRLTEPIVISWSPKDWLHVILSTFQKTVRSHSFFIHGRPYFMLPQCSTFTVVDQVISSAIDLHHSQYLEPEFHIFDQPVMDTMISQLLRYLRPEYAAYHARAVNLIGSLESSAGHSYVESILARSMTLRDSQNMAEPYEAFGVLWRLTGKFAISFLFLSLTVKRGLNATRSPLQASSDDNFRYTKE